MVDMRYFAKRVLGFLILAVLGYCVSTSLLVHFSPKTATYLFDQPWLKVNEKIAASKGIIASDTVVVGGSVANQILPFNDANYLTSVGAIRVAGNYLLIKNTLDRNPHIRTVIYMIAPIPLIRNLSQQRTHQYFVKPFYTFEHLDELNKHKDLVELLNKNDFLWFNLFVPFKLLSMDDFNYWDGKHSEGEILSKESYDWLVKMKALCEDRGVTFNLVSSPVPQYYWKENNECQIIKEQVKGTELETLFDRYFATMVLLEDSVTVKYGHMKEEYAIRNKERLRKEILSKLSNFNQLNASSKNEEAQ